MTVEWTVELAAGLTVEWTVELTVEWTVELTVELRAWLFSDIIITIKR